jgi:GST-like protein
MPAIVDRGPPGGGAPLSVFESGAILVYLARKTGKFMATDPRGTVTCLEWLFWQMGGLGPMTGQYGHFTVYASEKIPYAIERYTREARRLLGVLDKRLHGREYICGNEYSIADMACYPWIDPYEKAPLDLTAYAEVRRWRETIRARPATARAYAQGDFRERQTQMSEAEWAILFGGETPA